MTIREKLIANGVKNLKEFGYSDVTATNIITDQVYSAFFKSMLKDNKGHGHGVDDILDSIIAEIENTPKQQKKARKAK